MWPLDSRSIISWCPSLVSITSGSKNIFDCNNDIIFQIRYFRYRRYIFPQNIGQILVWIRIYLSIFYVRLNIWDRCKFRIVIDKFFKTKFAILTLTVINVDNHLNGLIFFSPMEILSAIFTYGRFLIRSLRNFECWYDSFGLHSPILLSTCFWCFTKTIFYHLEYCWTL